MAYKPTKPYAEAPTLLLSGSHQVRPDQVSAGTEKSNLLSRLSYMVLAM